MSATPLLEIDGLYAAAGDVEIIKNLNLTINPGEVHALMGPNGSGKSTLANILLGHPAYTVTAGTIRYKGEDLAEMTPDKRAQGGMFLGFQYPEEIPGVNLVNFLRTALSNRTGTDYTV
ncbi:MAG TPA: ATP-binding cassette domain-containing protein, partial [Actinobacteria bacterium]|nr:ATP-binding cassette domain-containing protein [Actinomycetota bacterium]